jgi:hypothetical protein
MVFILLSFSRSIGAGDTSCDARCAVAGATGGRHAFSSAIVRDVMPPPAPRVIEQINAKRRVYFAVFFASSRSCVTLSIRQFYAKERQRKVPQKQTRKLSRLSCLRSDWLWLSRQRRFTSFSLNAELVIDGSHASDEFCRPQNSWKFSR